jgi:DNA-binding CsgD family transcriptional regulator
VRGRDAEQATIERGFETAATGQLVVTTFSGDAGIGKTRLLQHALHLADRRDWTTLVLAPDLDSALSPLGALIDAAERSDPALLSSDDIDALMVGTAPQYWLTRVLGDRLEAAANASGALVIVDDVQWLDPGSLGVITALLRDLQGVPVFWLLATRSGSYGPAHRRLMGLLASAGQFIELTPLDAEAVGQMARDEVGAQLGPRVSSVMDRASGFPLVVLELIQGLEEEGLLLSSPGIVDIEHDTLPARFGASARDRLQQVGHDALRIAQVGSLYGRTFPVAGVLDILGKSTPEGSTAIQELLDHGFILDTGVSLAFRHDTVQVAALGTLTPTLRRAMAREVLYRRLRAGERPAALAATIASIAEPGEDASIELLIAAAHQLSPTDMQGAAELATQAARLSVGHARLAEQVAGLVPVITAGATIEDAISVTRALVPVLSADSRARVSLALARRLTESDFHAAIAEATTALDIPGISDATRVELLAVLALNNANIADPEGLRAALDQAHAVADTERDAAALATIHASESVLTFYQGHFAAAQLLQSQASELIEDTGTPSSLWLPEGLWMAFMRNSLGFCGEALALADGGLVIARSARNVIAEAYWSMVRARTLYDLGRLDEARTQAESVRDLAAQIGLGDFANATAGVVLHRIALHTGDYALRDEMGPLVQQLAEGAGLTRTGRWSLALEALDGGRVAEAHAYSALALASLADPLPSMTTPADFSDDIMLALICDRAGDHDGLSLVARIAEERAGMEPQNELLRAVAVAVRGIRDHTAADLLTAVYHLEKVSSPLVRARVLEVAGAYADEGAGDAEPLRAAARLYNELGAARDAGRVLHALRGRGVRTRLRSSNAGEGTMGLSQREQQIAERVAAGLTTQQIADDLLLSPHTVVAHIRHVFAKWNVNTRKDVATQYREKGAPAGD